MDKKSIVMLFLVACIKVYGHQQKPIKELLQKLETVKDSNKVKLLIETGNYYAGISRGDSNKYYINEALKEAEKCRYDHGKSRALTVLGYIYKYEGDHNKAMDFFLKALDLKEKLNLPLEAAAVKEAIGRIFIDREEPDKALKYFNETKKVYDLFNDSSRLVPLLGQYASYHEKKKDYKSAIEYYRIILKIYNTWQKSNSTLLLPAFLANYKAAALKSYAMCLVKTGKAKEAIAILEPLYIERKKIGGATRLVTQGCLVSAYLHSGKYQLAIQNCEEAIDYLQVNPNLKLLDNLKDLNRDAADAYYAIGNYKKAYAAYKSFKEINDSIVNEKVNRVFAEMQTKYETEKKDARITDLNEEKRTQWIIIGLAMGAAIIALGLFGFVYRSKRLQKKVFAQKEDILRKEKEIQLSALQKKMSELEQMALRAQMNPHFIFNSLNSVQHFVMKQDVEGVNKYLVAFAHLVRQTLDNSGNQFISLNEEIKYLDAYLTLEKIKSSNMFNYTINIGENINPFTTFIPGMILQPFVENSIRHGVAYKEKKEGQVNINISKNGRLVCLIEDNGIGRKKASEIKLESSEPTYDSKGMSITMHRIDIINEMYNTDISVHIDDIKDLQGKPAGTRVQVEFPTDMD